MISGIKVGPGSWKEILTRFQPQCCEVWYRVDWGDRYEELFAHLKQERIPAGLHFWGILPGGLAPNFAFPDPQVRAASLALAKQTIEVAAAHSLRYVNVHPGSYRLARINLDRLFMRPIAGREVAASVGERQLLENLSILHEYAQRRGVLFLTETIPAREPMHWRDLVRGRSRTQNLHNVPVSAIELLARAGFFVCNDLCHTTADVIADDPGYLFDQLLEKTKRLAVQTKLVHVNTLPRPFNGTDGHLGIRRQDFSDVVFPTREQLKQVLGLFRNRNDVWVIPEPFSEQVENTLALEELLEEIKN